jgi:glutathione synthase/RimK-type ligase-like ATP-grasp enzyme
MVVIDDPESIVRCSNKVYQAELFLRHNVKTPKTQVVHRGNQNGIGKLLGYPVVLKQPDSSFSAGVTRANDETELKLKLKALFKKSELVVAQEFLPSEFDWRVGVLGGKAIYVAKYFMAKGHWQVQRQEGEKGSRYGRCETMLVEDAPQAVVDLATRAAGLIGRSLYGVDIKELANGTLVVMEVNDNPNIDSNIEDAILKDELYTMVIRHLLRGIEERGQGKLP